MRSLAIRTRLALAAVVAVTLVLGVVGTIVYALFRSDLRHTVDTGLRSRATAVLEPGAPAIGSGSRSGALVDPEDAFAQRYAGDGTLISTSPGMPDRAIVPPSVVETIAGERFLDVRVRTPEGEDVPARALVVRDGAALVLVGASVEDQTEALQHLALFLLGGGLLALALVSALTWRLLVRALRPVEAMSAEAAAISASEPGRRLPVPAASDEISRLGETLNAMLERLEEALDRERRFVRDASHELRLPLANLKAELDLALRRARTPDELEAAIRSAAEEADGIVRLAEDLLVLARTQDGRLPLRLEAVDIADVVTATARTFATRAASHAIALDVHADGTIPGDVDPVRLAQAVGNALDNAIGATPANGRITVEVERAGGEVVIEVRDTGPGFPRSMLDQAFDAFARAPGSPAANGAGLGLAIVRAVADAHGGRVMARNVEGGGAVVRIEIPLRTSRPRERGDVR